MNKYIKYAITSSVASSLAIGIGVFIIESLLLAWVWALGILAFHVFALVAMGYREIMAEFGPNGDWAKHFEQRMGVK